jgi:hypothetical protein
MAQLGTSHNVRFRAGVGGKADVTPLIPRASKPLNQTPGTLRDNHE